MMTVPAVGLEARGVAGLEHGLAVVLDQHDLAFEHIDELVFLFVPVPQRRGRAGLERRQVDAELVEADRIAEALALAADDHAVERRRIAGAGIDRQFGDIDLGHCAHTRSMIVAVPMPAPMQSVTRAGREVAPLEFIEQRAEDHGAGGAERMAQRDGAAIDVDLRGVELERLHDSATPPRRRPR